VLLASSGWDNALTALLPFILLIVFWIFMTNRLRGEPPPGQDGLSEKLEEIRQELERIRKAIESRP